MRVRSLWVFFGLALAVGSCSRSSEDAKPPHASNETPPDPEEEGETEDEDGFSCEGSGISKTPWVLAIDKTSAKIRWEACREGISPELSLTKEGGSEAKAVSAVAKAFEVTETYKAPLLPQGPHDWAGTYYMHEAALTDLEPSTCYSYELVADTEAKGRFCTTRASGESFKFLVIGDTNPGLGDNASKVLQQNLKANPDFVLHTGDIQYYASLLETWAIWWPKMQPMLAQGAFFPAVGNHEYEKPKEFELYYTRFFDGAGFDGTTDYYRFESGGVWFFSLNTELEHGVDSEQGKWLKQQLEDAKARPGFRFSVVFLHRPWATCGDYSHKPSLREAWTPIFHENEVKLALFGHMHGYERFELDDITFITSAGGGGHLGNIDANMTRDECEHRVSSGAFFNATVFEVSPGKLKGTTTDEKGEVRDEFTIDVP